MASYDPSQSLEAIRAALDEDARRAWDDDAASEISPFLDAAARAIWRVSQEPLDLRDVEP